MEVLISERKRLKSASSTLCCGVTTRSCTIVSYEEKQKLKPVCCLPHAVPGKEQSAAQQPADGELELVPIL